MCPKGVLLKKIFTRFSPHKKCDGWRISSYVKIHKLSLGGSKSHLEGSKNKTKFEGTPLQQVDVNSAVVGEHENEKYVRLRNY